MQLILKEHLGQTWSGHPVSFPIELADLKPGAAPAVRDLCSGETLPGQVGPDLKLHFIPRLAPYEVRTFEVDTQAHAPATDVRASEEDGCWVLSSDAISIGVPIISQSGRPPDRVPAPIVFAAGPQRIRRGRGLWCGHIPVASVSSRLTAAGPVFAEAQVDYEFGDGTYYRIAWRVYAGAPVAIATETKSVRDGGVWKLSLHENFAPDTAHWRFGTDGVWPIGYKAGEHICRHIYSNHWDLYQDFKELSFLYRADAGDASDAIGVFPVDGNAWTSVVGNIISLDVSAEPDAAYSFSLSPGRRQFGVFAIPLAQTRESDFRPTDGIGAYKLRCRWSFVRLDDVKEMVLDWDEPPRNWPAVHASPERLEAAAAMVRAKPEICGNLATASALFNGDPAVVAARKKSFFDTLRSMCKRAVVYGPNPSNCNPVMMRPIVHMPLDYEVLMMRGALTPEEDRRARAMMAFLAYFTDREDYDFGRRSMLPAGHPDDIMTLYKGMRAENMSIDRWIGVGVIGLMLRDHPKAGDWRQMSLELFETSMEKLVADCGAWCEGWNYYYWSLHLLLNFAHPMRSIGVDLFAYERFRAMIAFVVESLSPRSPAYEGRRIPPCFGSYGEGGTGPFGYLAAKAAYAYAKSDPELSARLMWAYHEIDEPPMSAGIWKDRDRDREMIALYCDFDLPAKEPVRMSRGCKGAGAIFHHTHEDGRETYLIGRASPLWPHGHVDAGSFFMYYKNAPLISEAARGNNAANKLVKHNPDGHNTIVFDNKPYYYAWPCRQDLLKFESRGRIEYAVLDCRQEQLSLPGHKVRGHGDAHTMPVDIRHFRHIVFIKPDLFVIYDAVRTAGPGAPYASDYRLHCYAAGVQFDGSHAIFTGNHGIDLDANVVLPAKPAFATKQVVDTHSMEFANGPDADYLVVLSPREAGTRPLSECTFDASLLTVAVGNDVRRISIRPSAQPLVYDFEELA